MMYTLWCKFSRLTHYLRHITKRLQRFTTDERGSASLEAVLVFPLIVAVIIIMMLAAVYAYQLVHVQYVSLTAAERASYNWDARDREFHTAQADSTEYYGLYEHEQSALLLRSLIPLSSSELNEQYTIHAYTPTMEKNGKLIQDKLAKTEAYIVGAGGHVTGSMSLSQRILSTQITVSLQKGISPLFWQQQALLPSPSYTAQNTIHAPTQFIRNVDLFMYYTKRLSSMTSEQKQKWKSSGGKAVKSFSSS